MRNQAYWAARAQRAAASAYATQEIKTAAFLKAFKTAYDDLVDVTAALYAKYSINGELSLTELYRYGRYTKYIGEVKAICEGLGNKESYFAKNLFSSLYRTSYSETGSILMQKFAAVPNKTLEKILEHPWSGANYSDRIWINKDKLLNALDQTVVRGVIKGNSITMMTDDLRGKVEAGAYDARRLIRTESMHFINKGQIDGYKRAGITEVDILV